MGMMTDPIDAIEDTTVRRFVRVVVHVRRFLPFYVTGAAFALAMAVVPAVDGGGGDVPAATTAARRSTGTAGGPSGTAGPAARSSTASVPAAARAIATAAPVDAFADSTLDGTIDSDAVGPVAGAPTSAALAGRNDAPVAAPDVDTPTEFPDTPSAPEPCKLEPPSPAPAVDPARELTNGQNTAQALTRQELPVDAGQTVAPASQEALCNVPAAPVEAPAVPLPATPVSERPGDGFGPLPLGWLFRLTAWA